jgi:hypothetical protein
MKRCEHCGGDGHNDLYLNNECAACYGTGEVPDAWWWDEEGVLHAEGPWSWDTDPLPEQALIITRVDGFRPRRTRPEGWFTTAIKEGVIRSPALGENPPQLHPADAHIIRPPGAPAAGSSREQEQE